MFENKKNWELDIQEFRDKFKKLDNIDNTTNKLELEKFLKTCGFKEVIFLINKIGKSNIEYIKNRSDKLNGNSSYTIRIMELLNDERIPLFIREINVEKYIIDYEINYFLNSIEDNNTPNLLKIHKEVRKVIVKRLDILCNAYTINNYKKLIESIDNVNSQCVLIICLVGFEIVGNLSFASILKN